MLCVAVPSCVHTNHGRVVQLHNQNANRRFVMSEVVFLVQHSKAAEEDASKHEEGVAKPRKLDGNIGTCECLE